MTVATAPESFDPMITPVVHVVTDVIPEIPDVVTLRMVPTTGDVAPFLPAQVSMVGAFGIGEAAISISSSPSERAYHEYTIRHTGAITSALTHLRRGDRLWTRGPFGRPWDLHPGGDLVIAAGGIGVAPLRSAILHTVEHRDLFGAVVLVVGARTSHDLLYRREYEAWRDAGIDVIATIDHDEAGWSGAVGFVPTVIGDLEFGADTRALICGPDIMMRRTADALVAAGVDPDRIQVTLERNMQCGTGRCGHCQLGGMLVCRDGPVADYPSVARALSIEEW